MPHYVFKDAQPRPSDPWEDWMRTVDRLDWSEGHRHQSRASVMRRAKTLKLDPQEVTQELLDRCGCNSAEYESKIRADVTRFLGLTDSVCSVLQSTPKAALNEDLFRSITANPTPIERLRALSPAKLRPDDDLEFADEILDSLFPPNPGDPEEPWICAGYSVVSGGFCTKRRERWRGRLRDLQYLVPQRMTKEKGVTQTGILGWHSLASTGPWEHLPIEWDDILLGGHLTPVTHEEQVSCFYICARLAVTWTSCPRGAQILAGLVQRARRAPDRLTELQRYAESLGACSGPIRNRSQFVRMPGGLRKFDDGTTKRQSVLFFHDRRKHL